MAARLAVSQPAKIMTRMLMNHPPGSPVLCRRPLSGRSLAPALAANNTLCSSSREDATRPPTNQARSESPPGRLTGSALREQRHHGRPDVAGDEHGEEGRGQGKAVLEREDLGGVGAAAAERRHGDVPSPRIDPP